MSKTTIKNFETFEEVKEFCFKNQVDRISPLQANKNIYYKCIIKNCNFKVYVNLTQFYKVTTNDEQHNHPLSNDWTPMKKKKEQKIVCIFKF